MLTKGKLTPKELLFLAELMDQGADAISTRNFEEMSKKAYEIFSAKEKDKLEQARNIWNSSPDDFEPGFFGPTAWPWLYYYADVFRELAAESVGEK